MEFQSTTSNEPQTASNARLRLVAQYLALGLKTNEIGVKLGVKQAGGLVRRAYDEGYYAELLAERNGKATTLYQERETLARECLHVMNTGVARISKVMESEPERIDVSQIKLAKECFAETEHTGKKVDAPVVQVNIKQEITDKLAGRMSRINSLLAKAGMTMHELETA